MLFTSGDKRLKGFGRILVSWSSFLVGEIAWFRWAMMRWQESIGWICAEGDESTASEKNGTRSDSTTISEKLLTSNIVKCLQRQNFLCCYHLKQNFQCVKWPQAKTNFQDVISSSAKLISSIWLTPWLYHHPHHHHQNHQNHHHHHQHQHQDHHGDDDQACGRVLLLLLLTGLLAKGQEEVAEPTQLEVDMMMMMMSWCCHHHHHHNHHHHHDRMI